MTTAANSNRSLRHYILAALLAGAAACDAASNSTASAKEPDSASDPRKAPGYIIDSARTMEEELSRFQAALTYRPTSLEGGADSREALVRQFLAAVAASDTVKLAGMHVSMPEFGFLYFPHSEFMRPPYELPPGFFWMQMRAGSSEGLTHLLRRFGSRSPDYVKHECAAEPKLQGENKIWEKCLVHWRESGEIVSQRLFGSIIELGGNFKFLTFANDL